MSLAGHHALVTGGGTGIGAAIARRLVADGARVSLIGRRAEPLADVASRIDGHYATADVTDPLLMAAALDTIRGRGGPITILINNAGAGHSAPFGRLSFAQWRATLAVNLDSLFVVTQACLPDLIAAPAARIVTVASIAGLKGSAYTAAYTSAKHGAVGFTRALAAELPASVTVNAVCPGYTDTDLVTEAIDAIVAKTGRDAEQVRAHLASANPGKTILTPEQVAATVAWLCRPDSSAITGQAIVVAGGEI